MGKTVLFDVRKETVSKLAENMKENDRVLVVAPLAGHLSTHAPAKSGKYKGYHRIKCEVLIPADAIKGENAITDFTAAMLLTIPDNRVSEHLRNE